MFVGKCPQNAEKLALGRAPDLLEFVTKKVFSDLATTAIIPGPGSDQRSP
jgi:hypothetical protein